MNPFELALWIPLILLAALVLANLAVRGIFRILRPVIFGMNRFEKIAWFNLVMFMVTLLIIPALIWCLRSIHIEDPIETALQFTAIIWMGEWGRNLFKKDQIEVTPELNEQDQLIRTRAMKYGTALFVLVLLLFLIGMCGYESICLQRKIVLTVVVVGFGFARVVRSLSIAIQYRLMRISGQT